MALNEQLKKQAVLALVASDYSYRPLGQIPLLATLKSFPDSRPEDEQPFPRSLLSTFSVEERTLSFSPYHFNYPDESNVIEFDNWVVDEVFETQGTGFGAVLFRSRFADDDGKREYLLAFRGTDGLNAQDWFANIDLARNVWGTDGSPVMQTLLNKTDAKSITFTGQSLGGALAQYGLYDYATRLSPTNRPALSLITFNGFGAVRGLKDLFPNFNPNLVSNVPTAHLAGRLRKTRLMKEITQ